ncbi:MAG: ATP-binding protein, partial [Desulfotomaculales bacterium]
LNMIVEKLLFFARPAQSKFIPVDLNLLVENALQFFAETTRDNFVIKKELAANLPLAKADAEQMEQALKNIFFNAFQAMPEGGTLTVRTSQTAEGMLYIDVLNTGCGIAEEDLPRIFDPFFTTRTKGTGLGLTIAYEILQAHGGGIEVASRPGEGSLFRLFVQPAGGDLT